MEEVVELGSCSSFGYGVCSLMMFLEMLHRKPFQSCPIASPSTLSIILLLCYRAEEKTGCVKRAVATSLLWFPSEVAGASNLQGDQCKCLFCSKRVWLNHPYGSGSVSLYT